MHTMSSYNSYTSSTRSVNVMYCQGDISDYMVSKSFGLAYSVKGILYYAFSLAINYGIPT